MSSIYTENKQLDDDMLTNLLLMATDEDLEASITDAESEDPERAQRLRLMVSEAQAEWRERAAAATDEPGTGDEGGESETEEPNADNLLISQDGQVLDGVYSFTVNVLGWLQLDQQGQFVAYFADPMDLPLGTYGTIEVDAGVPGEPLVTPPPPEDEEDALPPVDMAELQRGNISILNAMFVEGASASQREARVLTHSVFWMLKNKHDASGDARFGATPGIGKIEFTRNRMTPNEIVITDDGGLDVDLIKREIRDLLDRKILEYPYRDRTRVNIH